MIPEYRISITGTYGQMFLRCDDCGDAETFESGTTLDGVLSLAVAHTLKHTVRETLARVGEDES